MPQTDLVDLAPRCRFLQPEAAPAMPVLTEELACLSAMLLRLEHVQLRL